MLKGLNNGVKVRVISEEELGRLSDVSEYTRLDLEENYNKEGIVKNYMKLTDEVCFFNIESNGELLKDANGYLMAFSQCYVEVLEELEKLEVGQTIICSPELSKDKDYSIVTVAKAMLDFKGKEMTIKEIDSEGLIQVNENEYLWERGMVLTQKEFEKYNSEEKEETIDEIEEIKYNIGDKIIIDTKLSKKRKYKNITVTDEMIDYVGEIGTVNQIILKDKNIYYKVSCDNCSNLWNYETLLDLRKFEVVFNAQLFSKRRIAIHLKSQAQIKKFVEYINELEIKWSEGSVVSIDDFEDVKSIYVSLYNKGEENVLTFDDKKYFDKNQFQVVDYTKVYFNPNKEKATRVDDSIDRNDRITYKNYKNKVNIGDLYYKESSIEGYTGWYLVTANCSIGLNTGIVGAWSDVYVDIEQKDITKCVFYNQDFGSNTTLAEFMRTFDESKIVNFIKTLY